MLCSRCSEVIKPIVAVDIDGTLGDYHGHFLKFATAWLGKRDEFRGPAYGYEGEDRFSYWFCWTYDVDLPTYRAIKLAYRQGGMKRSMPIFPGAQGLCWAVKNAGAELWVTTTRPYLSLDNIVPDTVEWLRRYGIEYDGMLFDEDKYAQLAQRVDPRRVVAVLDDLPEMCEAADLVFPSRALQVISRYNAETPYLKMTTLDAAPEIVLGLVQDWRA